LTVPIARKTVCAPCRRRSDSNPRPFRSERNTENWPQKIARAQSEATAANGWLVITSTAGIVFVAAADAAKCRGSPIELIDDDYGHVVLP